MVRGSVPCSETTRHGQINAAPMQGMAHPRLLLLEQTRQPETDLLPSVAKAQGAEMQALDPFSLRLQVEPKLPGGALVLTANGQALDLSGFDALVIRSYRCFALTKALASVFVHSGRPVLGLDPGHPAFSQDKFSDLLMLAQAGVDVPSTWSARRCAPETAVAKANWGYGGQGVELLGTEQDTEEPWNTHYQPFLPAFEDWRVLLCEGEALPWIVVRRPSAGDFRTNTHQGGMPEVLASSEVPQAPALMRLAEKAGAALGRPNAGVDLRAGLHGHPVVLEVNRTPRLRLGGHTEAVVSSYVSAWLKKVHGLRAG